MTDKQIIELYFDRNEAAIHETEVKYGSYCRKVAANILGDKQDVDECINDTWLSIWKAIPPLIPENFKIWAAKITRNFAINRYRAVNTERRGGGRVTEVLDELALCVPDNRQNVEGEYIEKELTQHINTFLKKQPAKKSNYFVRRYFYGETIEEIAKRYGVSKGSVMTSLSRTREALKKYLEQEGMYD